MYDANHKLNLISCVYFFLCLFIVVVVFFFVFGFFLNISAHSTVLNAEHRTFSSQNSQISYHNLLVRTK